KNHAGNPNIYVYSEGSLLPNPYAKANHHIKLKTTNPTPIKASRLAILKRSSSCSKSFRSTVTHPLDRKSTRLNSSHVSISYAVFCLKQKEYEICRDSTS